MTEDTKSVSLFSRGEMQGGHSNRKKITNNRKRVVPAALKIPFRRKQKIKNRNNYDNMNSPKENEPPRREAKHRTSRPPSRGSKRDDRGRRQRHRPWSPDGTAARRRRRFRRLRRREGGDPTSSSSSTTVHRTTARAIRQSSPRLYRQGWAASTAS